MDWSVAQAKQQFSEVVRRVAEEPQAIYNRSTAVAVVVSVNEFEQFSQWKARQAGAPWVDSIARLRAALAQAGHDGIDIETRPIEGRPNSFDQMLDEEYGTPSAPPTLQKKGRTRGTR